MARKCKIQREHAKAAREAQKADKRAKKIGDVISWVGQAIVRTIARHPVVFGIIDGILLLTSVVFFSVPSHATDDSLENLTVDAVWLECNMLHIEVTNKLTGIHQTLQMQLDEYAGNSEYVSVQAVDRNGNKSNTIQFKNPFYEPDGGSDSLLPTSPLDGTEESLQSESGIREIRNQSTVPLTDF